MTWGSLHDSAGKALKPEMVHTIHASLNFACLQIDSQRNDDLIDGMCDSKAAICKKEAEECQESSQLSRAAQEPSSQMWTASP